MTIKIAHVADTHLGYRQYGLMEREQDFYESFEKVVDSIIDHDVDYVIHSGDLFEQPKPPINALLCAQKGFLKLLENDIEVLVIAGNHDIIQRRNTSIPQELYENDKFHILTLKEPTFRVNNELVISGVPFVQKSYEDVVKDILNEILDDVKGYKHKILMLHGGVSKYFDFNPEFELDTIPHGFDYYAMGHIHKRVIDYGFKGGILSYPGSTEIKDKGEILEYENNKKGYNLLSIEDEINVEYVNIELERKFIVQSIRYPELDDGLDKLESKISNEILTKTEKKPVLLLTVKEGDFDRSDVAKRVYDKLGKVTLTVRLKYEPTIINDKRNDEGKNKLNAEELIKEKVTEAFGEDIGQMSVDLYKALSKKDLLEAQEITETYYNKRYNKEGEDNDNQ